MKFLKFYIDAKEVNKKFKEDLDELVYALEQINLKEAADGEVQYQSGL